MRPDIIAFHCLQGRTIIIFFGSLQDVYVSFKRGVAKGMPSIDAAPGGKVGCRKK